MRHVSLAECREVADALRERGIEAYADGQPACACCPEEVWSVVVGACLFTDEEGEWWGADARAGTHAPLGIPVGAPADDVATAIERAVVLLVLARDVAVPS